MDLLIYASMTTQLLKRTWILKIHNVSCQKMKYILNLIIQSKKALIGGVLLNLWVETSTCNAHQHFQNYVWTKYHATNKETQT